MAEEQKPAEAPAEGAAAPAEGEASAEGSAPAGNKKKKMLLIASAGVAVVGVLVAVGVVFFMGGEHKAEEKPTEVPHVAIYDVPEMNVNLLSEDPTTQHFLKVKLAVELANNQDTQNAGMLLPKLQDDWMGFLRQMRVSDLQGSANLQRLKEGLLRRANQALDPVGVKGVYIREVLVQ